MKEAQYDAEEKVAWYNKQLDKICEEASLPRIVSVMLHEAVTLANNEQDASDIEEDITCDVCTLVMLYPFVYAPSFSIFFFLSDKISYSMP